VPPMLGAREDAISAAAHAPTEKEEEFMLEGKQLRGWSMLMFGLRFAWDMLWYREVETRTIFLPKRVVAELRSQVQGDLASKDGGEERPYTRGRG
jgi:hypothetical protein